MSNHPPRRNPSRPVSALPFLRTLSLFLWRWRAAWVLACCALGLLIVTNLATPPRTAATTVIVARTDLPVGASLTRSDLVAVTVTTEAALLGGPATLEELVGATLATPLAAGALIRPADLVPTSVFDGAPPGSVFTVVTIENAGLLAYLRPGMRIDLFSPDALSAGPLARGATVMALGKDGDLTTTSTGPSWSSNQTGADFSSTVLIATSPDQSQTLALGSNWQGLHATIVQ